LKFYFLTAGRRELLRAVYLIGFILHPLQFLSFEGVPHGVGFVERVRFQFAGRGRRFLVRLEPSI
jgi:hypothetical protein